MTPKSNPLLTARRRMLAGLLFAAGALLSSAAFGGTLEPYTGPDRQPGFSLEDLQGRGHALDSYRGRVLLINFWASWCPPCIQEMPALQRLEARLAGRPFSIVAINTSEKKYKVRKFVKLIDLRLQVLLDPNGEAFAAWGGEVLPTSFLLDPTGRIAHIGLGPLQWDSEEVVSVIEGMLSAAPAENPTATAAQE